MDRWICSYGWPGNIREVRNLTERAALLCTGDVLEEEDLAFGLHRESPTAMREEKGPAIEVTALGDIRIEIPPWGIALEDVERKMIQKTLRAAGSNVSRAAGLLHLSRDTLRYRIRKFGLDPE